MEISNPHTRWWLAVGVRNALQAMHKAGLSADMSVTGIGSLGDLTEQQETMLVDILAKTHAISDAVSELLASDGLATRFVESFPKPPNVPLPPEYQ